MLRNHLTAISRLHALRRYAPHVLKYTSSLSALVGWSYVGLSRMPNGPTGSLCTKPGKRCKTYAVFALAAMLTGCTTTAHPAGADWAFPASGTAPQAASNPATIISLPGSSVYYTRKQIKDGSAIDWRPRTHPPLPPIVQFGRPPNANACGSCHLPDGNGRPENASLAGLPAVYITQQMHALQSGTRQGARPGWPPITAMLKTAHALTAADITSAATYFSNRTFVERTQVVEAGDIPAVVPDAYIYRRLPGNHKEKLGARIIETPDDFNRFELRDGTLGFTTYVPLGSIARGQTLAETGNRGRIPTCMVCHGSGLRGTAIAPPLAGRSATYLFRQLDAFRTGSRQAQAMQTELSHLSMSEFIDLAAYAASLKP
jgi:cytochrome c553